MSDENQSIIVVHRGHDEHDEHHGGVWKIAYADFMTAMMAFFLVMWLVNASNDETKAAVASYFNPVRLTDRNARPRGLDDPVPGSTTLDPERETEALAPHAAREAGAEEASSGGDGTDAAGSIERAGSWTRGEASDPLASLDPFDPLYDPPAPDAQAEVGAMETATTASDDGDEVENEIEMEPLTAADVEASDAEGTASTRAEATNDALAGQLAADLAGALETASVEVVPLPSGILIRLADDPDRSMFGVGASEPSPRLSDDLRKVAEALLQRPGKLAIHGHTDARPFRGVEDGNWRLSADRARTARELLVAGGLDAGRIESITAHADTKPRLEADPLASGNRRIELILHTVPQ